MAVQPVTRFDNEHDAGSLEYEQDARSLDYEQDAGSLDYEHDAGSFDDEQDAGSFDNEHGAGSFDDEQDADSVDYEQYADSFDDEYDAGRLDYEQDAGSLDEEDNGQNPKVSVGVHIKEDPTLEYYFCQAVEYNYDIALKTILTKAMDPSAVVNKDYNVKGNKRFVPMLVACEKGHINIVETLLQNGGAKSLQKHNKHKCNCLHAACRAGNFHMVKLLCEYAFKQLSERVRNTVFNRKSEKGQNVVYIAAQHSLECLKALQSSHCVSSDLFLATDKKGWGVIHRTCADGNISTLKWLLELRTPVESKTGVLNASNSPNASKDVLSPNDEGYSNELPLLFGSVWQKSRNKNGFTPLLVACQYQHKEMVEYLLGLESMDPSSIDDRGNTGLHIAAIHDSPELANLLICYRCLIRATNKEGDTALHVSRRKSSFEVADILKSKDADLQQIQNKNGQRADEIEPEEVTPPEILKRGPEAVRAFHKALREGKQKLPQCKLLVLGEACVGKTSLVRHLTGLQFEPNLVRTRGIENKCIETMVDSKHIDTSNWRTFDENEQASRDHENFVKGIADAIKKEDPTLLKTEVTEKHLDKLYTEVQITEDDLLKEIHERLEKLHQARIEQQRIEQQRIEQQRIEQQRIEQQRIEQQRSEQQRSEQQTIQQSGMGAQQIEVQVIPDSTTPMSDLESPIVPQIIVETQTVSPPEQEKQHIADQPLSEVGEKTLSKLPRPAKSVPKPKTISNQPQSQQTTQRSGLGRRSVRIVYNQLPSAACKTEEPTLCFEVLDFAGQEQYRPMHHCFMSRRAIYIVVSNLQQLCDPTKSDEMFTDLKYWLNSIHAHVFNPSYKYDKYIFLVGTHKNPGNGQREITDEDLKKLSSDLQKYLFGGNCRFKDEIHFYSKTDLIITGLENSLDQCKSGIEIIKKEIASFSKSLPFLTETYPISWVNFRAKLLKRKLSKSPILELSEAKQMAKDCGVDEPAVHTALQLFHDSGVIIYPASLKSIFLEDSEKNCINCVILMDPRWLIGIMKKVMEVKMSHPVLCNTVIDRLLSSGITTALSLFNLWQDDHHGNYDHFRLICFLIRAHGLMQTIKPNVISNMTGSNHSPPSTEPQLDTDADYLQRTELLIPCMLSQEEKFNLEGYKFYFDFKGFLPQEVFHCLICLVIKKCQEVPGNHYSPKYWTNACIWYCMKGYDWNVQLLSGEHKLKVIARPRKRKPDDLSPLKCISYIHEEYIRPICEQSGLPGLSYVAGPFVEVCSVKVPPHSTGVLAAVCYPESGTNDIETLCKCGTCGEEYDNNYVLLHTHELDTSGQREVYISPALGEDDLIDVMEEVMDVAGNWRVVGLALRLKQPDLHVIEKKRNNDPTECLRDTLEAWLQQRYDVQKHGPPSWHLLCKAVKARAGGNNPALADAIAKKHST